MEIKSISASLSLASKSDLHHVLSPFLSSCHQPAKNIWAFIVCLDVVCSPREHISFAVRLCVHVFVCVGFTANLPG